MKEKIKRQKRQKNLPAVLELLFLLCDPAVDLLPDLAELQRGAEDLPNKI